MQSTEKDIEHYVDEQIKKKPEAGFTNQFDCGYHWALLEIKTFIMEYENEKKMDCRGRN